ncbi:dihydropteroate synthase [Urechidicola sp. KH5]
MTLNCKGNLVDVSSPKVMGILNITPDSFYDGGTLKSDADVLKRTEYMLENGARFIDVGAYSSRPDAEHISANEEKQRLLPIIELLLTNFPEILISVDTFRSNIAEESINIGAAIINDISGGSMDDEMFETIGRLKVPYVLMHMQGTPQTMQKNPSYSNVVTDIRKNFSEKLLNLRALQLSDIILDVGFGFGKSIEHNYELLSELHQFKTFDKPILAGISRKSMLYKTLNTSADKALNATSVANTIAIKNGANILRVHDVKEASETIKICKMSGWCL